MPNVNDVRVMAAAFRARMADMVRYGEGDPIDDDVKVGTTYFDKSTAPATAWTKQRSGWVKASHGATE